jgi:hypothetical protein
MVAVKHAAKCISAMNKYNCAAKCVSETNNGLNYIEKMVWTKCTKMMIFKFG